VNIKTNTKQWENVLRCYLTGLFLGGLSSRSKQHTGLLLVGLHGGLGDLSTGTIALLDGLDDSDGNGLSHISYGESSERSVVGEWLDAHWLGWQHLDNSRVTRLNLGRVVLNLLTRSSVDLLDHLVESAGDVRGVAIENWGVSLLDFTWVVQDDDLSVEALALGGWVVLGVRAHITSSDVLDGDVLDVEADVVAWYTLWDLGVVHLDRLDLSGDVGWREFHDHTGLDDTGLDSTDWHSSNTTDLVDILEWESEGLVGWSDWLIDGVEGLEEGLTTLLATLLGLLSPALVPRHVSGRLDHVISVPARDRYESNGLRVVTDLLDVVADLLHDLLVSVLGVLWLGVVHLVDANDELLDAEGEGEQSVLSGLTVLGDTGLELTDTGGDDEDGAIGLRGSGDHVLDKVTVAWRVDDGDLVLVGLELPEGDIDGDTSLSLGLQLVQNPSVLEGAFAHLGGFLLELLDSSLVDTTAFVDQMTGGGRFTGIDVSDDDDIDMSLCLSHVFCKFDLRL